MADLDGFHECIEDANYVVTYLELLEGHIYKPLIEWEFPNDEDLLIWINKGKYMGHENHHHSEDTEDSFCFSSSDNSINSDEEKKDTSENEEPIVSDTTEKPKKKGLLSLSYRRKSKSKILTKNEITKEMLINLPPDPYEDGPYTLEKTVSSMIGMYIFSEYVEEICNDPWGMAFVAEVSRYRKLFSISKEYAIRKAKWIVSTFLDVPPLTNDKSGEDQLALSSYRRSALMHIGYGMKDDNMTSDELLQMHLQKSDKRPKFKPPDLLYGKYIGRSKDMTKFSPMILRKMVEDFTVKENLMTVSSESHIKSDGPGSTCGPSTCSKLSFLSAIFPEVKNVRSSVGSSLFSSETIPDGSTSKCTLDLFDKIEAITLEVIRERHWRGFTKHGLFKKLCRFVWLQQKGVRKESFAPVRVLGRGGFGLVHAVKKKDSGMLYAVKTQEKCRVKAKKCENLIVNEHKALAAVNSPFVTRLMYAYESPSQLFLVLDLLPGGTLAFHLHQERRFQPKVARYFASCIMLGLQALHSCGFVYRDLKPDNILMDSHGYIKLSDLGLVCKVTPSLHGVCGTRGYWAPEVLQKYDENRKRVCYDQTSDWFSFGCVVYEMVAGKNPFYCSEAIEYAISDGNTTKKEAVNKAIMEWDPTYERKYFDDESIDLCSKLLSKDPKKRLGVLGCEEIMTHPWFRKTEWPKLIINMVDPPYRPPRDVNALSQNDIGTFNSCKVQSQQEDIISAFLKLEGDNDFEWTWTNPEVFQKEVIGFLQHERTIGGALRPQGECDCCCSIS
eukprot:CAMPEP_0194326582 /NCGR_PEP_ID=MMETSP0171-20130528/37135_1 /TAXON_ID=218684 /ORGANISM="Corethron pennatum, Strain L29A3" /LENGTH=781 /DNA_ID=CAMNT_0039086217 /DNA_START=43 /DNA_END=2388 /DNA_ORIENTATION=-